jgi:hypothetical protein
VSSSSDGGDAGTLAETPSRRAPTWPRFAVVVGVLVLAFIVSRTIGSDFTQEEAVAKATELVDFVPEDTQIRLLRQGLDRHPFWIISLSIPKANGEGYSELAVVRIDAESGEVVEFREQKNAPRGPEQAP